MNDIMLQNHNIKGITKRIEKPKGKAYISLLKKHYEKLHVIVSTLRESSCKDADIAYFLMGENSLEECGLSINSIPSKVHNLLQEESGCFCCLSYYLKPKIAEKLYDILQSTNYFYAESETKTRDKINTLLNHLKPSEMPQEDPKSVNLDKIRSDFTNALQENSSNIIEYYDSINNLHQPSRVIIYEDNCNNKVDRLITCGNDHYIIITTSLDGSLWEYCNGKVKLYTKTLHGVNCLLYKYKSIVNDKEETKIKLYKLDPDKKHIITFKKNAIFNQVTDKELCLIKNIEENKLLTIKLKNVNNDDTLSYILNSEMELLLRAGVNPNVKNRENKYFNLANQAFLLDLYKDVGIKKAERGRRISGGSYYSQTSGTGSKSQAEAIPTAFNKCFTVGKVDKTIVFKPNEDALSDDKIVLTFLVGGFQGALNHHTLRSWPPQQYSNPTDELMLTLNGCDQSYEFSDENVVKITLKTVYKVALHSPILNNQELQDTVIYTDTFQLYRNPNNPIYEVQLKLVQSNVKYEVRGSLIETENQSNALTISSDHATTHSIPIRYKTEALVIIPEELINCLYPVINTYTINECNFLAVLSKIKQMLKKDDKIREMYTTHLTDWLIGNLDPEKYENYLNRYNSILEVNDYNLAISYFNEIKENIKN